jgi:threonyl-tRNA synthetase
MMKVPYMLVVGDQEMASETVSLRRRDGVRQNDMPVGQFVALVQERIAARSKTLCVAVPRTSLVEIGPINAGI